MKGLETLNNDDNPYDVVNVVLVGDSGVGKTNLIHSYASDQFL